MSLFFVLLEREPKVPTRAKSVISKTRNNRFPLMAAASLLGVTIQFNPQSPSAIMVYLQRCLS